MGYYNVVESCVVGKLHYTRPTVQPIEVDDAVAAPLVATGKLTRYGSAVPAPVEAPSVQEEPDTELAEAPDESPAPELDGDSDGAAEGEERPAQRPRARRKSSGD